MRTNGHEPGAGDAETRAVDLGGIVLPDALSGEPVDLGAGPRLGLLVLIRHRY